MILLPPIVILVLLRLSFWGVTCTLLLYTSHLYLCLQVNLSIGWPRRFQFLLPVVSWCICHLSQCLGTAVLVHCNRIIPKYFGIWDGSIYGGIIGNTLSLSWGPTWIGLLQEWTRGRLDPWDIIVGKPGMAWPGGLALTEWLDKQVVVHFVCGTWCGVQWADMGQYLWGATLEVAAPVSCVGCATLELAHMEPVC